MTERHVSPSLRHIPDNVLRVSPLSGVEAKMHDRLWRAIVEGKLRPGAKLREDVIGETFGVSRTVVRKVMVVMEQEGIAHLPPNHGAYVATPTPDDARAVHETFLLVTSHIIGKLASRKPALTAQQRTLLERHIDAQAAAEAEHDATTARLLSGEFGILLGMIHGNRILTQMLIELVARYRLAVTLYQSTFVRDDRANLQREIVKNILARKPAEAVSCVETIFESFERSLTFDATDDEIDLKALLSSNASLSAAK